MKKNIAVIVIVLNLAIVAAQLFVGYTANSVSLLVDAFHNFGDVLAVGISLTAAIYITKAATEKMTFGYIRAEMMAGFVNSSFLCVTMLFLLFESFKRFFFPENVDFVAVAITAGIALSVNGFSAYLLAKNGVKHHHDHDDHACEHSEDMNLKSAYLHFVGDAMISLGVVTGSVVAYFWHTNLIDPALSILFSIYIFFQSFKVLKTTFFSLMDMNPLQLEPIRAEILSTYGIESLHDMHIHSPSSKENYLSAHIVMSQNMSLQTIEQTLETLRVKLATLGITHTIFQPETAKYAQEHSLCCTH